MQTNKSSPPGDVCHREVSPHSVVKTLKMIRLQKEKKLLYNLYYRQCHLSIVWYVVKVPDCLPRFGHIAVPASYNMLLGGNSAAFNTVFNGAEFPPKSILYHAGTAM